MNNTQQALEGEVIQSATTPHDQLASLSPNAQNYAAQIMSLAKSGTENTIDMCEVFFQAKNSLGDEFATLCAAINYDVQSATIKKYVLIGENADKFRQYIDRLPSAWTTLYQMTQLSDEHFHQLMTHGKITPLSTGEQVKLLAKESVQKPKPKPIPTASIKLLIDDSMNKDSIKALISELEALGIEYKFQMELSTETNKRRFPQGLSTNV